MNYHKVRIMRKVILITNKLFQYRVEVYNYFSEKLREKNIELFVIANKIQEGTTNEINFKYKLLTFKKYLKEIKNYNPDVTITFLNLSYLIIWPVIHYIKIKKIPFVYWGHGVNLQDPNNKIKNILFHYIHNLSNTILLYTPEQIKYIKEKNRNKIFIANNTLNFSNFPIINETKKELREKHNISFNKTLIFVSRILPYKRVDVLIDIFKEIDTDFGLIIIGDGMPNDLLSIVKETNNIKYLGPIYEKQKVNEYFKLSDIFCIPGANGLSINQAMYWGLPCLTLNVLQGPEAWYIKQDKTGYIVNSETELKEKILYLFNNEEKLNRLSENSYNLMRTEGSIKNMFNGFYNAIKQNIKY